MSGEKETQNQVFDELDDTPQMTTRSQAGKILAQAHDEIPGEPSREEVDEAAQRMGGASGSGDAISDEAQQEGEYAPPAPQPSDD